MATSRRLTGRDGTRYATEADRLRDQREEHDRREEERRRTRVADANTPLALSMGAEARAARPPRAPGVIALDASAPARLPADPGRTADGIVRALEAEAARRGVPFTVVLEEASRVDPTLMDTYRAAHHRRQAEMFTVPTTPAQTVVREFDAAVQQYRREHPGVDTGTAMQIVAAANPVLAQKRNTAITLGGYS